MNTPRSSTACSQISADPSLPRPATGRRGHAPPATGLEAVLPRSTATQHITFDEVKCCGLLRTLPDSVIGFTPMLERGVDLTLRGSARSPPPASRRGTSADRRNPEPRPAHHAGAGHRHRFRIRTGEAPAREGVQDFSPEPLFTGDPAMIWRSSSPAATSAMKAKKSFASQSKPSVKAPEVADRGSREPVTQLHHRRGFRQRGGGGCDCGSGRGMVSPFQGQGRTPV